MIAIGAGSISSRRLSVSCWLCQADSPPATWIGGVTQRGFGKAGVARSLAHVCGRRPSQLLAFARGESQIRERRRRFCEPSLSPSAASPSGRHTKHSVWEPALG
jgi:hypothetical protein